MDKYTQFGAGMPTNAGNGSADEQEFNTGTATDQSPPPPYTFEGPSANGSDSQPPLADTGDMSSVPSSPSSTAPQVDDDEGEDDEGEDDEGEYIEYGAEDDADGEEEEDELSEGEVQEDDGDANEEYSESEEEGDADQDGDNDEDDDVDTFGPASGGFNPSLRMGNYEVSSDELAHDAQGTQSKPAPDVDAPAPSAGTAQETIATATQEATPTATQENPPDDTPVAPEVEMDGAFDTVTPDPAPQTFNQSEPINDSIMLGAEDTVPPADRPLGGAAQDADMSGYWQQESDSTSMYTVLNEHTACASPMVNQYDQTQPGPIVKRSFVEACQLIQSLVTGDVKFQGHSLQALLQSLLEEAIKALKTNAHNSRMKMHIFHTHAYTTLNGAGQALGSNSDQLTRAIHQLRILLTEFDRRLEQARSDPGSSKKRKFTKMLNRDERPRKMIKMAQAAADQPGYHVAEHLRLLQEKMDDVSDAVKVEAAVRNKKVTALEKKVNVLDEKVTALDKKVTVLDEKVTLLDKKVTALTKTVKSLASDMAELKNAVLILGRVLAPGVSLFPEPDSPPKPKLEVRVLLDFHGSVRTPAQTRFLETTTLDLGDCQTLREVDVAVSSKYVSRVLDVFELRAAAQTPLQEPARSSTPNTDAGMSLPPVRRTMRVVVEDYATAADGTRVPKTALIKSGEDFKSWMARMA